MPNEFDVIVIGGGPGGYVFAIRAAQLGLRTALVEREWLGGVCLNVGCIPSKSLLTNAETAHTLRHRGAELGFAFENLSLDYSVAVRRSRQVVTRLRKGVEFLMTKNKIAVLRGRGRLTSPSSVEVTAADGSRSEYRVANIVVATGARAATPPGVITDGRRILSYRDAIVQEHRPGSAVIVGGGAIGVEFATLWNAYGTHVTLVEALPRLVPLEDEEVSAELAKQLRHAGVEVRTGTPLEGIETTSDAVKVRLAGAAADPSILEADQVLVATGFTPNSQDLGLGEIGVELDPHGFVQIDDHLRTNVPGVWAIGDVTGKLLLAHVASAQGIACAEFIAGHPRMPLDYNAMPRATYCRPQIASVGFTEAQAKDQGRSVRTARFSFIANGKALGAGQPIGWVKIVADAASGVLLGAHLIGPEVTELLPELTLAYRLKLPAEAVAHNVHAHPTLSEVVMEAAHGLAGGYIHA